MIRLPARLILAWLLAMVGTQVSSPARQTSAAGAASAPPVSDPQASQAARFQSLKTRIDALKADKPAWRGIAWRSCLLEGLKRSRIENKPALLWIFIDRPIDDARC